MVRFIDEEKNRYSDRIVLFDLPPVQVGDDVVAISDHLDALLLVVEDGKTQSDNLSDTLELLQSVNLLGVVLNKTDENAAKYGHYK
jgi:Mrp family chromosome partitioning ATPase